MARKRIESSGSCVRAASRRKLSSIVVANNNKQAGNATDTYEALEQRKRAVIRLGNRLKVATARLLLRWRRRTHLIKKY